MTHKSIQDKTKLLYIIQNINVYAFYLNICILKHFLLSNLSHTINKRPHTSIIENFNAFHKIDHNSKRSPFKCGAHYLVTPHIYDILAK